jgi:hypothetical protein
MRALTLDTGALIALDRGSRKMRVLLEEAQSHGGKLVVPTCVLAQAWRDGSSRARLARLLKSEVIVFENLDAIQARAVGELCGLRGTSDIVDAFVVIVASRHGRVVATSDPGDLTHLDRNLVTVPVD